MLVLGEVRVGELVDVVCPECSDKRLGPGHFCRRVRLLGGFLREIPFQHFADGRGLFAGAPGERAPVHGSFDFVAPRYGCGSLVK